MTQIQNLPPPPLCGWEKLGIFLGVIDVYVEGRERKKEEKKRTEVCLRIRSGQGRVYVSLTYYY